MESQLVPRREDTWMMEISNHFSKDVQEKAGRNSMISTISETSSSRRKAHCQVLNCAKLAHGPTYQFCLRHGGGYRCQHPGCTKSAYSTKYCSKHGGGPRCQFIDCNKGSISNSSFCRKHGGGPRCQHPNCMEGARANFKFCVTHGGFMPCQYPNCPIPSLTNQSYCRTHNTLKSDKSGLHNFQF
jgi:hypothetical protein